MSSTGSSAQQRWYHTNKAKIRLRTRAYYWRNPMVQSLRNAKMKSKKRGLEFNIDLSDVPIPEICPVLGIPITLGMGQHRFNSPSIDRIIPELGYVKGNVRVISLRANLLKSDITPEECKLILKDIEKIYEDRKPACSLPKLS